MEGSCQGIYSSGVGLCCLDASVYMSSMNISWQLTKGHTMFTSHHVIGHHLEVVNVCNDSRSVLHYSLRRSFYDSGQGVHMNFKILCHLRVMFCRCVCILFLEWFHRHVPLVCGSQKQRRENYLARQQVEGAESLWYAASLEDEIGLNPHTIQTWEDSAMVVLYQPSLHAPYAVWESVTYFWCSLI